MASAGPRRSGALGNDERIGYLEARVEDQSQTIGELRELIIHLDRKVDVRFQSVGQRFDAIDRRFEAIDRRFEGVEFRLTAFEDKIQRQFEALAGLFERQDETFERKLAGIDERFDRRFGQADGDGEVERLRRDLTTQWWTQFRWLVGIQMTTLAAVLGALLAR